MTKTKIAIAAVLFAATSSVALAQGFDPDLSNRYQGYAQPNAYGYSGAGKLGALGSAPVRTLQSAPVSLQKRHGNVRLEAAPVLQQRDVALPTGNGGAYYEGDREFNVDRFDHASSPYAGGN